MRLRSSGQGLRNGGGTSLLFLLSVLLLPALAIATTLLPGVAKSIPAESGSGTPSGDLIPSSIGLCKESNRP